MAEANKFWLASYHLIGVAQQWYFQLEHDEGEPIWRNFKEYVNLHFGPSIRHNPLGELKELRQTSTVEEYQGKFPAILCRAEHLQPRQQVQLFTPGLREPIRTDVELQNPASLQMSMALARSYERRALASKEVALLVAKPPQPARAPPYTATHVTPPASPAMALATLEVAKATGNTDTHAWRPPMRRRFLTLEKMTAHREAGLYYNCEERFTPNHRCKRLFSLISPSTDSDDAYDDTGEEPDISLYTLTGIQPWSCRTM